ncbi:MAG: amino acid amidase [Deltaproteobacteria bacterium]|jgi:D-amino peptidase|nr:amino acid amidase [Deltaproteobacteria bacterium]MBT4525510.1 amino acid amidase [Deltaproteobacteria bacterium]
MKIYISADIEGVTGTTVWDEADKTHSDYSIFSKQMTNELIAACEGAFEAGANEIWIKDAHSSGRNIIPELLPENTILIRGWSGHPYSMMQEIDNTFQAVLMTGYHASDHSSGNPLSHTLTGKTVYTKINDLHASEFLINTFTAADNGVPVVFLCGDQAICDEARSIQANLKTVAVKQGIGASTVNISSKLALQKIKSNVTAALEKDFSSYPIELPEYFQVEICFKDHKVAYRSGFYPGVTHKDSYTILFETENYFDVLRLLRFIG